MAQSEFVLRGQIWQVPRGLLIAKCGGFDQDPTLPAKPYEGQSYVRQANFQVFVEALKGEDIAITTGNFSDLDLLCKEFRFLELSAKVSKWMSGRSSTDLEVLRAVNYLHGCFDDFRQQLAQQRKECCEQRSSQEQVACYLEEEIAQLKSESVRQRGENEQLRSDIAHLKREADRISQSNASLEDAVGRQGEERKLLDGKVTREISQLDEKMQQDFAKFREEVREMCRGLKEEVPALARDTSTPKTGGAKISSLPGPASAPRSAPPASAPTQPGSPAGPRAPPPVKPGRQFAPSGDLLKGIIAHLTAECGGNVDDRGVVAVTSSEVFSGCLAKYAVDLEDRFSCFWSVYRGGNIADDARGGWICYDFKKRRIVPTDYAIRTVGGYYPRNWVVETSRDGNTWAEVDRRKNMEEMKEIRVTRTFAVSRREECMFIRLVHVGENWYGNDSLCISKWEVFGSLVE